MIPKNRGMDKAAFIGTWRLKSYEVRKADGTLGRPWGEAPEGRLMYSADGYVSVAMMGPDRPTFKARELKQGTDKEKVAAADSYISYAGRYEVEDNRVIHHVEVCLFPNWVGKDQVRNFEFDGNRLLLSTVPDPSVDNPKIGCLVWERV